MASSDDWLTGKPGDFFEDFVKGDDGDWRAPCKIPSCPDNGVCKVAATSSGAKPNFSHARKSHIQKHKNQANKRPRDGASTIVQVQSVQPVATQMEVVLAPKGGSLTQDQVDAIVRTGVKDFPFQSLSRLPQTLVRDWLRNFWRPTRGFKRYW
jgi:hypothetical protein